MEEKRVDVVNYEHYITYSDKEIVHELSADSYGLFDKNQAQYQLLYNVQFACNKLFPRKIIEDWSLTKRF